VLAGKTVRPERGVVGTSVGDHSYGRLTRTEDKSVILDDIVRHLSGYADWYRTGNHVSDHD